MPAILLAIRWLFGSIFSITNIRKWLGFIVTHWKAFLVGAFVSLFIYIAFSPVQFLFGLPTVHAQESKVAKLEQELSVVQSQLKVCEATNMGLSDALDDQNKRIKSWSELSSKIDDSTAQLVSEISISRLQSKADVAKILTAPTPKTCEESLTFMSDAVRNGELVWKKGDATVK